MIYRATKIYDWENAPNELKRLVAPDRKGSWNWLALVPPHRLDEASDDFGWVFTVREFTDEGALLVAGCEAEWFLEN